MHYAFNSMHRCDQQNLQVPMNMQIGCCLQSRISYSLWSRRYADLCVLILYTSYAKIVKRLSWLAKSGSREFCDSGAKFTGEAAVAGSTPLLEWEKSALSRYLEHVQCMTE
jgi:hypothetical protein